LWAVGYQSVWVVLLPVQLTELLFPERRNGAWLNRRGRIIAAVAFVLGSRAACYGWTQTTRVKIFHMPPYIPPALYLGIGAAVDLALILTAYALPNRRGEGLPEAPPARLLGTAFFLLGAPWAAFAILGWGAGIREAPLGIVFTTGVLWAAITFFLAWRWTSAPNWNDQHRFAVVFGGVLACSIGGFVVFRVGGALGIDWIGKAVFDSAALGWLVSVGRNLTRSTA